MRFIVRSWDVSWRHRPHQREEVIDVADLNAAQDWAARNAGFGRGFEVAPAPPEPVPEPELEQKTEPLTFPVKPSRSRRKVSK